MSGVKGCRRSHWAGRNKLVRCKSLLKRVMYEVYRLGTVGVVKRAVRQLVDAAGYRDRP